MSRYKAYSEYKNSGVEWLDTVPTHWSRVAIKYMALEEGSLFLDGDWIESKDISSEGIKYITTGNIGEGAYKEQGSGFISEDKFSALNCTEVFPGDVLISRLNAPIGRACVVPYLASRVVTSVDNVIFRPDQLYSKEYLVRLFSSPAYFEHTSNLARGATMQRISRGLLGNIRVVLPPKIEQEKIAAFLDYETAKIDALIEKQQRLIELLKEKRQAVISHAVTKGLNPNAPMKESGMEWVERVPAHWRVSKLGYHASVSNGATPSRENMLFWENGTIGWLNSSKVNDEVIQEADQFITKFALSRTSVKPVYKGDLLMAITGEGQTRGRVAICNIEATINQHLAAISICDKLLHHEFLYLWLEGN